MSCNVCRSRPCVWCCRGSARIPLPFCPLLLADLLGRVPAPAAAAAVNARPADPGTTIGSAWACPKQTGPGGKGASLTYVMAKATSRDEGAVL